MTKFSRNLVTLLSTTIIALGATVNTHTVFADDLNSEIESSKVKIDEVKKEQKEVKEKLKAIQDKIKETEDKALEVIELSGKTQSEVDKLNEEIDEMQKIVDAREEKLQEQARTIQTNGEKIDIISIVIEAESLSEIVGKAKVINSILSSNSDMLKSQLEDKQVIERKGIQAKAKLSQLQDLSVELEGLKGELVSKAFDEKKALDSLDEKRSSFEENYENLVKEKEEKEAQELRESIREIVGSEGLSLDELPENSSAGEVVSNASKYLGTPYVWGGKSPSGFDCSGFTQYVYQETYGVNIGVWTGAQQYAGKHISISEAKPGDLLMWGKGSSTSHVAIYIGSGQFIHAPKPGDSVKVTSLKHFMPDYAVRVIE